MPTTRYDVFISYRREHGADLARLVRTELIARGYRVFLDVEELGAGRFDDALLRRIAETPDFVLILKPSSLDRCRHENDWLRQEIEHAFKTGRNIIPLGADGFIFPPPDDLPASIASLPHLHCELYDHRLSGPCIERLVSRLVSRPGAWRRVRSVIAHSRVVQVTLLLAVVALVALFGLAYQPEAPAPPPMPVVRKPPAIDKAKNVEQPVVVGVMQIHARGPVPEWMQDFTRDGLNTVLSKLSKLRVYSKQKIDFIREQRRLSELAVAEDLHIAKMISGTITLADSKLILEVQVVDIETGLIEDSERVEGSEAQLVELQNRVALGVVDALAVPVTPAEVKRMLADRTNDTLKNYRRLTESLDAFAIEDPPPAGGLWRAPSFVTPAYAAEPTPEEAAVRELIERYRAALQDKDLDRLASVQLAMSDGQREALGRYFDHARDLKVQFTDVEVQIDGERALATFTRNDYFKDAESGAPMHLEVRMSSEVTRQKDGWRIRGLRKPSS